ncbi:MULTISPECIES: hypothetical protein [unclassified Rhizobium]|uniref:hypothetical protein n=1 Tax=unclassified Rhizobium TaxID=2613769 RepID=UPI0006FE16BE|nr:MULTISPECIES: hypothetical protein [unclassified Rhizobium]KQV33138.1 hypothetical protein ASC86_18430 [Rhizobium sp. Root1212]KRD21598.1 hypothetical protein ASE37_18930 [Rhizobium sp. Root268]
MASKDSHNNLNFAVALNIGAISSNTTTNGAIIDTQGYESVEFVIQSGTLTDGGYAPTITEGDASDLTGGTATAAADLLGTLAGATFAATDDNVVKKIGYKGSKRYVRLNIVSTGVTTGGTLGATVVRGHARSKPVA